MNKELPSCHRINLFTLRHNTSLTIRGKTRTNINKEPLGNSTGREQI